MNESQWIQFLTLFLTTVGGFIVSEWRSERKRKWEKEDRAEAATKVREERAAATQEIISKASAEAEALRIRTEAIAESVRFEAKAVSDKVQMNTQMAAVKIREDQRKTADQLTAAIADVHQIATSAFNEANHSNEKIEKVAQSLLEQQKAIHIDKLDGIKAGVDEVSNAVARIEQNRRSTDPKP